MPKVADFKGIFTVRLKSSLTPWSHLKRENLNELNTFKKNDKDVSRNAFARLVISKAHFQSSKVTLSKKCVNLRDSKKKLSKIGQTKILPLFFATLLRSK